MKNLMGLILMLLVSTNIFAEKKNHLDEKPLSIKSNVVKMLLDANQMYRLELTEFAAIYHADEKFAACLRQSIKDKKKVVLTVSSQSLIVRDCKVE